MTAVADGLVKELLQLSPADRGELAALLIDSLDENDETSDAAWEEEIRTRIEDVVSGRVQTVPLEEALKQIFAEDDGAD